MEKSKRIFTNLEKVFVVVDYEAFKGKCNYRHKSTSNVYCGTFGLTENDAPIECSYENCPYVYAIVTEAKTEEKVTKFVV